MTSSKLRCDVKNWWRHISVKNHGVFSKLCRIYCYVIMMRFVKFHRFSSIRSFSWKYPFSENSKKRQIPMLSSTSFHGKVHKAWFWKSYCANANTLIILCTKFHYCNICRNAILNDLKTKGTTHPHWLVSLCQNLWFTGQWGRGWCTSSSEKASYLAI